MNRLLTTLLVWLLMATLPLHALAASVNLSCAPVPHHMGAPSGQDHAADDMRAHHGGHAGDADAKVDTGEATDLPHSSCSACSVFCVGAVAPPSAPLSLPSVPGSESVAVASADALTGFIPDGPQRPPRP